VYINGQLLAAGERDAKDRIRPFVLGIDVSGKLRLGRNVIALMASRGDRLVLKIVPAPFQIVKPSVLATDATWKGDLHFHKGWEKPEFDDHDWPDALSLGGIEEKSSFFQGNDDAGMYGWPGYDGISPFLAHTTLKPQEMVYGSQGMGQFHNISALLANAVPNPMAPPPGRKVITEGGKVPTRVDLAEVVMPAGNVPASEDPYLVLGFGKECAGRIRVISASPRPMRLEVQYGESAEEAVSNPYLGATEIYVPPFGTAYGPKSAFAYALVRFLAGSSPLRFKAIDVDYVYYPVKPMGTFESSDPLVNKIWEVGAYTAHLCMQDVVYDAPKRDRVCLAGGLDVSGRVISSVFGDRFLLDKSLQALIAAAGVPVSKDVNNIPGFSALWVMSEANYFRHTGDMAHLAAVHDSLRGLLEYMASRIDDKGQLVNANNRSTFIDWSPDLDGDSPESRRVTLMQFFRALNEGAWLLQQTGDSSAARFQQIAEKLRVDLLKNALDPARNTFGERWQTNSMAIFSGLADSGERAAIWDTVLNRPYRYTVTPHLNYYAMCAMAEAGRRAEALEWIRDYWGAMLRPETTTFWEGYDSRWPRDHFHGHLQTDHGEGYFVSLCHGWSSGPTVWLMDQVLGIQPAAGGFAQVNIRPDLCGLEWVRGAEPCPQGSIKVDYHRDGSNFKARIEVPDGMSAQVSMPVNRGDTSVLVDGSAVPGAPAEDGSRLTVPLGTPGVHELQSRGSF
jgi:hypothetical protein